MCSCTIAGDSTGSACVDTFLGMFLPILGHAEVVKWLLSQKQVSGNEKDHTQYTAAHEAAEQGHVK